MKRLILWLMIAAVLSGCANTTEQTFSPSDTKVAAIFWNSDTTQVIEIGSVDNPYSEPLALKIRVDRFAVGRKGVHNPLWRNG